jgi:nucleotide-binding universal stress UspA family protein
MSCISSAVDLSLKSVLVAVDLSRGTSQKPLRHALAIARHYGAKLCLVHVVSSLGLTMASSDAIAAAEESVWRDAGRLEQDLARGGAIAGLQHKISFVKARSAENWKRSLGRKRSISWSVEHTGGGALGSCS